MLALRLGGGGGTRHLFLLILYNFKNIGGGGGLLRDPCYVWCIEHSSTKDDRVTYELPLGCI